MPLTMLRQQAHHEHDQYMGGLQEISDQYQHIDGRSRTRTYPMVLANDEPQEEVESYICKVQNQEPKRLKLWR